MSSQIPLPLGKFDRFNFELYWPGPNHDAVEYLKQITPKKDGGYVYLWGEHGSGKSHLLQAACTLASSAGGKVVYIPLSQSEQIAPELLQGMESLDMVCIDDIDSVAGDPDWELALFNLYNQLQSNRNLLIVAARIGPMGIDVCLPDLKSRLAAGVTWHLAVLEETHRMQALQQRARLRGFDLPDDVMDFLSRRVDRDMHSLFDWLDRLDQASLVSKKKLTVPFVRTLLNYTE